MEAWILVATRHNPALGSETTDTIKYPPIIMETHRLRTSVPPPNFRSTWPIVNTQEPISAMKA